MLKRNYCSVNEKITDLFHLDLYAVSCSDSWPELPIAVLLCSCSLEV